MSKLKLFGPSVRILFLPIVVIISSFVFILLLFNFTSPSIQAKLATVKDANQVENTLKERVEVLKNFSEGILDDRSEQIYTILPDKNPSAISISQFKAELNQQNIILTGVETSASFTDEENKRTELVYNFEVSDFVIPLNLATALKSIAPLSTLDELVIKKQADGKIETELKAIIHWSDLPKKLPSLGEPITELSTEDQQLLSRVLRYKFPEANELNPELSTDRKNPFN